MKMTVKEFIENLYFSICIFDFSQKETEDKNKIACKNVKILFNSYSLSDLLCAAFTSIDSETIS
jgi:hypothetical protein